MELRIPHRLLQARAFLEQNRADDLIRVGGDQCHVGHRFPVVADEDDAIGGIVAKFVGAIDAARVDRLDDPGRIQIQVDDLGQAVPVPGPQFVIVRDEYAVRAGAVRADRTDESGDTADE